MAERNRLQDRNLSRERARRPGGSGLMSTIATVVILAGAGMAGANVSHGRQGTVEPTKPITAASVTAPARPTGSGHHGDTTTTEPGTPSGDGSGTDNGGTGKGAGTGGAGAGTGQATGGGQGAGGGGGSGSGGGGSGGGGSGHGGGGGGSGGGDTSGTLGHAHH